MTSRTRALVVPLLSLALLALAGYAIRRELAGHSYRELKTTFAAIPPGAVLLAGLATAASYALVALYDLLAIRHFRLNVEPRRAAVAGVVGFTFSNTAGHGILVGLPARYRIYQSLGCSAADVTRITLFGTATFWSGFAALSGLLFAVWPTPWPAKLRFLPFSTTLPLGVAALAATLAYLGLTASRRGRTLRLGRFAVRPPSLRIAGAQVALGAVDLAISGFALYALLPLTARAAFPTFLALYMLALLAGNLSFVPGGLGVFEAVILVLAPDGARTLVAPLLAYRVLYYWLPFLVAVAVLAAGEGLARWPALAEIGKGLRKAFDAVAPAAVATASLGAGAVLLVSGATPALHERLQRLQALLPIVEVSHFTASVVGSVLLLLAYGLARRLDSAWWMALGATVLGAVTSLGKGLDWEEALILVGFALLLVVSRRSFYRRGSMLSEPLSPGWLVAVVAFLGGSIWLGLFAHRHVEYSDELWFRFALNADAPRFLRASAGAIAVALLFAVARLAGRSRGRTPIPSEASLDEVAPLVAASHETTAHLALTGDKRFLLAPGGDGFLMYGAHGRSWVSMGDPVGPPSARRELARRFRDLTDRHDAWPVFYQVRPENLALYLDLGLSLLKLGEEARVALPAFSLDGAHHKKFRNLLHRLEREGCRMEILEPGRLESLLPELRGVSNSWLAAKQAREKSFSLGSFDEPYLRRCPLAVVQQEGQVLAFANLWLAGGLEAASVDLMRQREEAPAGVMDFLFLHLILWAQHEGYRWFDLGMAPLAGLEEGRLAPAWHRLAGLAFRHGGPFYNFRGIRQFKEKYDPVWEPRYLASPGGPTLPSVLANLAALIGGGLSGVFTR